MAKKDKKNQIGSTHINKITIEIDQSLFNHLINEDFTIQERQVWVLNMKWK